MSKKKNTQPVEEATPVPAMNPLMAKMLSLNSTIKATVAATDELLLKQTFFNTGIPGMNIALSGDVYGGCTPGVTVIAGPSKHFKSLFCLHAAAQFQRDNPDGIVIFFNNEFGINAGYMTKAGVDTNRVLHCPFTTIEALRADMWERLTALQPTDKVMFLTDSIGAGATMRELANAGNSEKNDDDRARAKAIKSLFRMVGPALNLKSIPALFVGHTRKEGDPGYETTVVSGGQGPYYFADNILVVSRKAIRTKVKGKEGDEDVAEAYNTNEHEYNITEGYKFLLKVEKGRFTQEDRVIPVEVRWNYGVCPWSGFDDLAVGYGLVDIRRGAKNQTWAHFPSNALIESNPEKYGKMEAVKSPTSEQVDATTGEVIPDVAVDTTFWKVVFENSNLSELIFKTYRK